MKEAVFVSHSSKDQEWAKKVSEFLEASGVPCWIAPRDVTPGSNYGAAIVEAIEGCSFFLLILSGSSNNSGQVVREVERAANTNSTIIPFRIEKVSPSKDLEFYVSASHWLDAFDGPFEKHLAELLEAIHRRRPQAEPPQLPRKAEPQLPRQEGSMTPPASRKLWLLSAVAAVAVIALAAVIFFKFSSQAPKPIVSQPDVNAERSEAERQRQAVEAYKSEAERQRQTAETYKRRMEEEAQARERAEAEAKKTQQLEDDRRAKAEQAQKDAEAHLNAAQDAQKAGNLAEERKEYQAVLALEPDNVLARTRLGELDADPTLAPAFKAFIEQMWKNQASNSASAWASDFAPSVDYCYKDDGPASNNYVLNDRAKLLESYPQRQIQFGGIKQLHVISPSQVDLMYTYDYSYRGRKSATGRATVSLTLSLISSQWKIIKYSESVERR